MGVVGGVSTVAEHPRPAAQEAPAERHAATAPEARRAGDHGRSRVPDERGTRAARPLAIAIRSLHVRARVVPVDADGRVLVPPPDPTTVGWWSGGVQTGAGRGAAVLTGHTVSTGGGAFDDLDEIETGALVIVTSARGRLPYVVTDSRTFPKESLARHAHRVFDQSAPARLVLVTCEEWNGKTYLSNHVVTARPVDPGQWHVRSVRG